MRRGLVLIALWLAAATASAQTPQPPNGRIAGVVTTADGAQRPLRNAYVVLIGGVTGTLKVTASDASGRFAFSALPADRYLIGASKPPYLGAVAGAKRPARPGTPVVLAGGQTIDNVAIRLPMAAAVSGTIVDENGQPAASVPVVVQQWRIQNGERTLVTVPSGNSSTDERGRFRIYGLVPGEYVIAASPAVPGRPTRQLSAADVDAALKGAAPQPPAPAAAETRYAPTYFPGSPRIAEASPVLLGVGDDRASVDFRIEPARTVRVDGTVMNANGQPVNAIVILAPSSTNSLLRFATTAQAGADGRFTMNNVSPGSYTAIARPMNAAGPAQTGVLNIDVTGSDLTGLQLTLRPPMTLPGRITFQADTPPPLAGRRLTIRSLTTVAPGSTPIVSVTAADGSFTIINVAPGKYLFAGSAFFGASAESVTWAIDSVTVDGRDATDLPFDVTSEAPPRDVVVSFTDRMQQLSGRLTLASGAGVSDYTLVLFPADRKYWLTGSRRILTARPGTDGAFTFGGPGPIALPPGDYLLAAVDDIGKDEQFDPGFLAALVPTATTVSLASGEKKALSVRVR